MNNALLDQVKSVANNEAMFAFQFGGANSLIKVQFQLLCDTDETIMAAARLVDRLTQLSLNVTEVVVTNTDVDVTIVS